MKYFLTLLIRLFRTGGPVLIAFLVGAVGMILGAVAGCTLMGPWMCGNTVGAGGLHQASCIAASLCSSYVGGSINFVAVSQVRGWVIKSMELIFSAPLPTPSVYQAVGLHPSLVPAAMAADNLAMAAYLAVLMAVPIQKSNPEAKPVLEDHATEVEMFSAVKPSALSQIEGLAPEAASEASPGVAPEAPPEAATTGSIALSLACAASSNAIAQAAASTWPQLRPLTLTIMAIIAMALSTVARWALGGGSWSAGASQKAASPFSGKGIMLLLV